MPDHRSSFNPNRPANDKFPLGQAEQRLQPEPASGIVPALRGRRVVLGVSGSIAAYKAADLASQLVQAGAQVDVVMTVSATRFVTPLTFQSLVHRPVVTDLFSLQSPMSIEHVGLAQRTEAVVIAPATADTISRLAQGRADDPLTATVLATAAPVIVAPAMEQQMYRHPATQHNLQLLQRRGVVVVAPEAGRLASGLSGQGRLARRETIIGTLRHTLGRTGDLAGTSIVVTAGGTQEPLDPVRVLTNLSSGKMGIAIAHAARDRGATVTLITAAPPPADDVGIRVVTAKTALQMHEAVSRALQSPGQRADALIMAAAVADYRPTTAHAQKRKKGAEETWSLQLVRNPDILSAHRGDYIRVGFAAETDNVAAYAQAKLKEKDLDWIVANDVGQPGSGFDVDTNQVTLFSRQGEFIPLPLMSKLEVADRLLDSLAPHLQARIKLGTRAAQSSLPPQTSPGRNPSGSERHE